MIVVGSLAPPQDAVSPGGLCEVSDPQSLVLLSPSHLACRGRVLVYHPHTGTAHVVASGLYYPDGVVVSEDGSHLLVVETDALRVVRLWLTGAQVGGPMGQAAVRGALCNAALRMPVEGSLSARAWVEFVVCYQLYSKPHAVCAQAGQREVLIHSLPGLPAGLFKSSDGNYWLSLTTPLPPVIK